MDLSVIIPARNEEFLPQTVDNLIANIRGDTEVIVVLDGCTQEPPLIPRKRLVILNPTEPIGQRGAMNLGAKFSNAKFVMKADAHCAFDEGFDVKLMDTFEQDWTVVPRMFNLHAFNVICKKCGWDVYQRPLTEECPNCKGRGCLTRKFFWKPRRRTDTDQMRFDSTLHFQYWKERKPEGDMVESMSFIGACWMVYRDRYWEMEGLDEKHGFWGQVGTEVACKTWLSGGKLIVNRKTWFAHLFRTQFSWPYHLTNGMVERAREYSRDLWFNNKWSGQIYPLKWLVDKFSPVPGWENYNWEASRL